MKIFKDCPCPSMTPWDRPQTKEQIAPGIWHITTAGHGGFFLSPERRAAMPAGWPASANYGGGSDGFFEEDCEWALVALAFPEEFCKGMKSPDSIMQAARNTFDRMYVPLAA